MGAAARTSRATRIIHADQTRKRSSRAGSFGFAQRGTSKRARKSLTITAKSTLKGSSRTSVASVQNASRDFTKLRLGELQKRSGLRNVSLEHSLKPPKDGFRKLFSWRRKLLPLGVITFTGANAQLGMAGGGNVNAAKFNARFVVRVILKQ